MDDNHNNPKSAKGQNKEKLLLDNNAQKKSKDNTIAPAPIVSQTDKMADDLIEEFERRINKTKSLLEEEKKREAKKNEISNSHQIQYNHDDDHNGPTNINIIPGHQDLLNNLTPEFKGKPGM